MVAPDTSAPTTIWLTDRSRFKLGTGRCRRARYLSYHAGPTGYGLTMRAESLPLATGLAAHEGVEAFAGALKADRLPNEQETRAIVAEVCARYVAKVEAKGFRGILGSEQTEETIKEQKALISGLLWTLRLQFLPWLHKQYRVVAIEQERMHFLSCTCGAPPLDEAEHIRRGCSGRALMLRTDLLAQRRGGHTLAYFECKTTGWESDAWAEQWETDPQLALGTLDAEARYGAEVSELYIIGLSKGRRAKDKYDDDGRKKQLSTLCYGYARPGNPPLLPEDWLPSYEWIDQNGEVKRKSKMHRRKGVWELATSDWPVWVAHKDANPALTPEEFWVRWLPESQREKVCFLLGPMNRQDAQLRSLRRSMDGEEARWQELLWDGFELQQQGHRWESDVFQAWLDREIPCSWMCRPFGKDAQCEFVPICHRYDGWQDPIGSGRYQPRLPHHDPETKQAIARGLLPEEAAEREEDER
jgi:hypothetical protein